MNKKFVAFVAGRSGGHIIPALTLAKQFKSHDQELDILFFTTSHQLDQTIIKKQGMFIDKHIALSLGNVPFFNIFKILFFIIGFIKVFFKSVSYLKKFKPTHVIGMGGYICIPVCLAAYLLSIPIHLYDLDAYPGKATRFLKKYATKIYICFAHAQQYLPAEKCELISYPIRFDSAVKNISNDAALAHLNLLPSKKTIFINGGSQGSIFINNCIKDWINLNPHLYSLIQIIHQTGGAQKMDWRSFYKELDIHALVFSYKEDLAPCYLASDIIICRAGAGSLFESLFFGKACLTIPLETSSTSHQKDNARVLAQQYPTLITMLTEQEIKHDNMALFRVLNKYIHPTTQSGLYKPGKPAHTH